MPEVDVFEELKREHGITDRRKEKYRAKSPSTITGEEDNVFDELKREHGIVGTDRTGRGTLIPDLQSIWEQADINNPPPAGSTTIGPRREAVSRALDEVISTEELMKEYGLNVPEEGREMPSALRIPLAILSQFQRGQFAVVGGLEGIIDREPGQAFKNFYRGLLFAEPHESVDVIEKIGWLEDHPVLKFGAGLAGDIALDPLTWLTFGASGVAKGTLTGLTGGARATARGLKAAAGFRYSDLIEKVGGATYATLKAKDVEHLLSNLGRKVLKEAAETVPEDMAVTAVINEIAKGTKLGKKLIPHGAVFSHYMPRIGGQSVQDVSARALKKLGLYAGRDLVPGGVLKRIDDIEATESLFDAFTKAIVGTAPVDWFGRAFVPFWQIKNKYKLLIELEQAMKAGRQKDIEDILERGRKLVKTLDDKADRELLTELFEDPTLLVGKKFVKQIKKVRDELDVTFNVDYFPPGTKISEDEAGKITDFFFAVARRLYRENSPVATDLVSGFPLEGTAGRLKDLSLGEGSFGEVFGGNKFEPLTAYFQDLIISHDAAFYNLKFGDFVVKIPGRLFFNRGKVLDIQPVQFPPQAGIDALAGVAAEAYVLSKLAGSKYVADGRLIWRRLDEVFTGEPYALAGRAAPPGHELLDARVPAHLLGPSVDPSVAWLMTVGGLDNAKRLGLVSQDFTLSQWSAELRRLLADQALRFADQPIPILVKRFVSGETFDRHLTRAVERISTHGVDQFVDALTDVTDGAMKIIQDLAKYGVSIDDFKLNNVILSTQGHPVLLDLGFFQDFARGVRHNVVHGIEPAALERLEQPLSTAATRAQTQARIREAFTQGPTTPIAPGIPGFHAERPLAAAVKPAEAVNTLDEMVLAHLSLAQTQALTEGMNDFLAGLAAARFKSHPRAMWSEITNFLTQAFMRPGLTTIDKHNIVLKFFQKLKQRGVLRQYAINDHINPAALGVDPNKLRISVQGVQLSSGVRLQTELAWALDGNKPFEPVEKMGKRVVEREWEEVVPVIVNQHPRIANMTGPEKERLLEAYNLSKEWKAELEQYLLQRGLIDPERISKFKEKFGLAHLPHMKDAKTPASMFLILKRALAGKIQLGALKKRDIKGTIAAINKEFGTEFFESDIATILTKHAIDVSEATASFDLVQAVAKHWGKPLTAVKRQRLVRGKWTTVDEFVTDPGFSVIDHPALRNTQIPTDIAQYITKYTRTFVGDSVAREFWNKWHKVLSVWKGYATFMNPGFHGRNFLSNIFQLYLKDGPQAINPARHIAAENIMKGLEGKLVLHNGQEIPYDEVMDMMRRYGVYGTGWFGSDIRNAKNISRAIGASTRSRTVGTLINPASQQNVLFQVGKYAGGLVENEARVVGFINDLIRTGNPAYAAQQTKKFLFDYTELTDFEASIMKGIIPFYTWMRKNIALQAEQIIKQPSKYGDVARFKANLEHAAPEVDERWVPKYFPELYAIRTPWKTKQGSSLYLNPNLPFQDLNRVFDPRDWLSSLHPFKAVIELATNKNFFTGKEIQKFEGEYAPAEWFDWIEKLNPRFAANLAKLLGAKKTFEPETKTYNWSLPIKVKYVIEQANPFFRNVNQLGGYITRETPFYAQEKRPYDLLSRFVGVKLMPYNVPQEVERSIFERRDTLRDLKKTYEQRGELPTPHNPVMPKTH